MARGVPNAHIIHADPALTDFEIHDFQQLGAEARRVDAQEWHPDEPVDAVVFINPYGFDVEMVMKQVQLSPNAFILWYGWSGRPKALQEMDNLQLAAAVTVGPDGRPLFDTSDLTDYFTLKTFDELSSTEQQRFAEQLQQQYGLQPGTTLTAVYEYLQQPSSFGLAYSIGFYHFPYKKDGECFIYCPRESRQ